MATMNKVMEKLDRIKPHVYTASEIYDWLRGLDGMVSTQVHGTVEPVRYQLPDDADKDLLVPFPFDDIYELYASAMIDYHNKEYNNYNNAMLMFSERMDAYRSWYIQHNPHGKSGNYRNVMG